MELGSTLYKFSQDLPEEPALVLSEDIIKRCLAVHGALDSLLGKSKSTEKLPDWVQHFESALARFSSALCSATTVWVKNKTQQGEKADVLKLFQECPPPRTLVSLCNIAAILDHMKFLEDLKAPEPTDLFEELSIRMKTFVKVESLDYPTLADLFPDLSPTVASYTKSVQTNVLDEVGKLRKCIQKNAERIVKYRLVRH